MIPGNLDYGTYYRGDTINIKRFTVTQTVDDITSPVDLTNVDLRATFLSETETISKTVGGGITKTDAINGIFQIDKFTATVEGTYNYDIEFQFPNGDKKTYVRGVMTILKDITPSV